MKCAFCHTENRPHAQFCDHCGASLVTALYCHSCQTENRTTAKYCDRCGTPLTPSGSSRTTNRFRFFNGRPVLYGIAALLLLWAAFNAYNFYENHGNGLQPASDSRPAGTLDQPVTAEPTTTPPSPPIPTNPAMPDTGPAPSALESEGQEAAEQAAQAAARAQAEAKVQAEANARTTPQQQAQIASAIHAIRLKINRSWIRPMTIRHGLKCRIRVRLMSDGTVIEAEIIASSGDEAFDTSAQNAVIQASPLPIPADKDVFDRGFRSFTFTFDPTRGT